MPKIHALTASVMANAALPCEYFSEVMSQAFLAKVNLPIISVQRCRCSSPAAGPRTSYLTSLNLFPQLHNENKHRITELIKGEDIW